jgi:hypothetical protein
MRVRIVCYEDVHLWILGKFALRLCDELERQGVSADISKTADPSADINHHVIYGGYDGKRNSTDTVMITHIDEEWKVQALRRQLVHAEMGICMSSHTLRNLTRMALPRTRLCYVNPAHDGLIRPRKFVLGITSKVQPTGCKREDILRQLASWIPAADFRFSIMGAGWDGIVESMRDQGIEVDYCDHFDYEAYRRLIPSLDFYLYFGQDEGSMGFIDALAAGVPTIVTPQGFHLDARGGISYAFNDIHELMGILKSIAENRNRLRGAVESWTWSRYASQHLAIWKYLQARKSGQPLPVATRRELASLGVALNPRVADLQTLCHRVLRKARRVGYRVRERIGVALPAVTGR